METADTQSMAWKKHILVVANVTATSDELRTALLARLAREPATFTLLAPATPSEGGRAAAGERLHTAMERMRAAGLELDGQVADGDPYRAVAEAWDPARYDEIILATLPMRVSKWLHAGLPQRVGALTGALVTHVVCATPRPRVESLPTPHREKSVMGPLSVLTWGGPHGPHERVRRPLATEAGRSPRPARTTRG